MDASEQGLFCPVAFMGAPAIQHEKLVAGGESELALSVLKQALASGLYGPEGDEGRSSVAGVSVRKEGDVWIASCDDLKRVDVSCEAGSRPVSGSCGERKQERGKDGCMVYVIRIIFYRI